MVLAEEEHGEEELRQEHVCEYHVPLDVLEPNRGVDEKLADAAPVQQVRLLLREG